MSRARFDVTFEIVTEESAREGDAEERGYISRNSVFRDAYADFYGTRDLTIDTECVECDPSPCVRPRWVTITNGMGIKTGAYESRSLHIPQTVTAASARRIARLLGARI